MNEVDIIITYVNCEDPIWYNDYFNCIGSSKLGNSKNRFRDLGTLRYLLRGIEENLKWIRKVHLVVSSDSQVPDWVNRNTVNIIYHSDIIPSDLLPVFNSCAIEMFLPLIQDLSPKYIYFNDDMFPINPIEKTYWFRDDKVCTNFGVQPHMNYNTTSSIFLSNILNSSRLVTGVDILFDFKHLPLGFITEEDRKFYNNHKEEIIKNITKIRDAKNYNQYLYQINYFVNNMVYLRQPIGKYYQFTLNSIELKDICNSIINKDSPLLCINDNFPLIVKSNILEERVSSIINAFKRTFPNKSKYENYD